MSDLPLEKYIKPEFRTNQGIPTGWSISRRMGKFFLYKRMATNPPQKWMAACIEKYKAYICIYDYYLGFRDQKLISIDGKALGNANISFLFPKIKKQALKAVL